MQSQAIEDRDTLFTRVEDRHLALIEALKTDEVVCDLDNPSLPSPFNPLDRPPWALQCKILQRNMKNLTTYFRYLDDVDGSLKHTVRELP